MSRRLVYTLIAAAAIAGCSSTTAPMACEGNPKCKADAQPVVPSTLLLDVSAGATSGSIRSRPLPPDSTS